MSGSNNSSPYSGSSSSSSDSEDDEDTSTLCPMCWLPFHYTEIESHVAYCIDHPPEGESSVSIHSSTNESSNGIDSIIDNNKLKNDGDNDNSKLFSPLDSLKKYLESSNTDVEALRGMYPDFTTKELNIILSSCKKDVKKATTELSEISEAEKELKDARILDMLQNLCIEERKKEWKQYSLSASMSKALLKDDTWTSTKLDSHIIEGISEEKNNTNDPYISYSYNYGSWYKTLKGLDGIMDQSHDLIASVSDILGSPDPSITAMLLRAHKWNVRYLVESFAEDRYNALKKAGLAETDLEVPSDFEGTFECSVCFMDMPHNETYALSCGHRFCTSCWQFYLLTAVEEGVSCVNTTCMESSCKNRVHESAFRKSLTEDKFNRYQMFLYRSLVEDNPRCKWCPNPACDNAVLVDSAARSTPVRCACGFCFCFTCADMRIGNHMPATCEQVKEWIFLEEENSADNKWMTINSKKCPGCLNPIEKNEGCMHMTCRCTHEFCWLCRGPWSEHGDHTGGYYECNKYETSKAKILDEKNAATKSDLELYTFYFHRYQSHDDAHRIALRQHRNAENKKKELMSRFRLTESDVKFIERVTSQLIQNRSGLRWSYVYGYSLAQEVNATPWKQKIKNLFEFQQEEIEKHTNYMSELYERRLDEIKTQDEFFEFRSIVEHLRETTSHFIAHFAIAGAKRKAKLGDTFFDEEKGKKSTNKKGKDKKYPKPKTKAYAPSRKARRRRRRRRRGRNGS